MEITLYGTAFPVFNVHSLLHLPDDALHFKNLNNCSAIEFENYLQNVKKMVKSDKNPLA